MCEELENIFVTVERDLWNKIFVVVVVKDVHVSGSMYFYSVIFEISDKQMQFTGSKI